MSRKKNKKSTPAERVEVLGSGVTRRIYDGTGSSSGWGSKQRQEEKITCSLVGEPDIMIGLRARKKISLLMEAYQHKEWLGYLVGEKTEDWDFIVHDLVIPPHEEANAGSATAEPFNVPDGCIGVIHSHHGMSAFHSGTDDSHVDRNFPVSITVARGTGDKLEYSAVGFELLPKMFTLSELQGAYELILGETLDRGNFRKKLRKAAIVEATRETRRTGGRPARLYRFRDDAVAEVKARRLFP